MKVALSWLKEFVDIEICPEELAEKLTRSGTAVEYIIYPGREIENVVTGLVVDIVRHPEADKLWICKLDVKKDEPLQIVTGADNVTKGCIVPVAQVGSVLPGGKKMKKAKLRNVESYGMLCSASELGIEDKLLQVDQRHGIFLLPEDTPIGTDIKEVLGLDDVVFEVELTANRGDCMSILGIAREVAAVTGSELKKTEFTLLEDGGELDTSVKIKIQDASLCQRFTARVLTDIKIKQSPLWMQNRLRLCGMRPTNNIVDVTNYIMLELGQPMHAYDKDTLSGNTIIARRSDKGEQLVTLDDIKRTLDDNMIVIADKQKAIGLGGVMGGLDTEISPSTKHVLLEAACFDSATTRKTARALSLNSEASSRFVHGIDRENIIKALDKAAYLMAKIGAAKVCKGVLDNYPNIKEQKEISLTKDYVNNYLGTDIDFDCMVQILKSLDFKVETQNETMTVKVPSWRNDVAVKADITEEIARINGYDNIVGTLPYGPMMQGKQSKLDVISNITKNLFAASGLNEVIGYSFINNSQIDKLGLEASDLLYNGIDLINPITDDFKTMRTTLLPGVLSTMQYNIAHRNEDIAIFEVGSTYIAQSLPLSDFADEQTWLCAAVTGLASKDWNKSKQEFDFYDVKGLAEELFNKLNICDCQFTVGQIPYLHPGKTALINYKDQTIGWLGQLHPTVAENFDLKQVFVLELKLSTLCDDALEYAKYEKLPRYPEIFRDLSIIAAQDISYDTIVKTIKDSAGKLLKDVHLFDLYKGKQIEQGFVSMTYALSFQSEEKTLTDQEVNEVFVKVLSVLEEKLKIKLR